MAREPIDPRRPIDPQRVEKAAADLLEALQLDLTDPHLAKTPARVSKALIALTVSETLEFTTFPNDENYDEIVIAKSVAFSSVCAHHLMVFQGHAHVGYLPDSRIAGVSKLARTVGHYAKGLQVQERLTQQIAKRLQSELNPKGVGVVIEASHTCMTARGIKAHQSSIVTSAMLGRMRSDPRTRSEFLDLIKN